jgi:hypothetical protein
MPKGWWGAAAASYPFQGHAFDVSVTPDKLPQPMKKRQQLAAKRLELQLSQAPKASAPEQVAAVSKAEKAKKVKPTSKAKVVKPKAKGKGEKPAVRKPAAGPMAVAMKKFMENAKQQGYKHSECMKMWMKSAERNAIIDGLPETERKRRRFENK